jgi:S-formylglutathione hydrolase FrmB
MNLAMPYARRVRSLIAAVFLLIFVGLLASGAAAQAAGSGRLSTRYLESKSLERKVPYNVILPKGYSVSGENRYPVLYLLHGLTGHYGDWAEKSGVVEHSAEYPFIIVMPEDNDGWYTDALNAPKDRYESFMIKDLIPEVEKNYRTQTERAGRMIAGLSMGGYGSMKLALKYPDKFVLAGSFSGALRAAEFDASQLTGWKALSDSINEVFGSLDSKVREENDVFKLLSAYKPEQVKDLPFIYVDCGTEDGLVISNREFATKLFEMKVPHEFRQRPGGHNWPYWDAQIVEFLQLTEKFISGGQGTGK